jgi:hypothetical protein
MRRILFDFQASDPNYLEERPVQEEWIQDDEVDSFLSELLANGMHGWDDGEVSWQEQLCSMENQSY